MSRKDGGEDMFALVELPMKRKRGRPRKAEGSSSGEAENQHHSLHPSSFVPANQQRNIQQVDGKPPLMGAGVGNNEIPNEHGPIRGNSSDSMLGQVVHGVIDADIGDGYLISFRLGGINMKGVALKSSRVAPITAANDVAPLAKMFLRRDIPFPNINQHSHVASEAATATVLNGVTNQKVIENGTESRPIKSAPTPNEEDPVLVKRPDEDLREAEEEPKSDCVSESLSNLAPGDEVHAEVSALKSSGSGPINSEAKVMNVELEQAPEPKPVSPKSPQHDSTTKAVQDVPMTTKSKPSGAVIDEIIADFQADQVLFPAEPKMAAIPNSPANTLPSSEPDPLAEVTLSLGLNQPFISSEVQNRPTSPEPKKCRPILDGGLNLNVESYQTTIPADPGPVMFLGPVFDLAGSSVADDPTPPWQDDILNIPSRDNGAGIGARPANADVGTVEVVERFVASEGND